MRRIRTAVVDVSGELPELDLSAADEWRIVVTHGNVPRAYFVMASPGEAGAATLELTLRRAGERAREEALYRKLVRRAAVHPPADLRVSVVVPTHRRPEVLVKLLASITDLDPEPDEVIVVDNDPGDQDCRALVDAVDFTYVREDRRGLNVARRTGLHAATGDVVVFTDDDCVVSPGWLAPVAELFADPLVGVAAGPGFAWELHTGAQLRREEEAGFAKGLAARRFDWRVLAPVNAGAVGSGNSMAVRRDAARALEVFPPELDAGTRAPAAGDLFAIFRFLSAGFDAVYEPRMLFWHRHPPGGLRATIRNYGHGAGAFYTKVLLEERELGVIGVWYWFVRRWVEALLDAQAGLADGGRPRVRWCYLKASLSGPLAWRRALSDLDPEGRRVLAASRAAAHLPPPSASGFRPLDRRLATLAAWRERMREPAGGNAQPLAMTTRDWLASGPRSPASESPRVAAVAALLDVLEVLRARRAWASIAARVRGEPAPRADVRIRMTRAEWRAAAHAAAGRPGRATPSRDASALVVLGPAHGEGERAAARAASFALVEASGPADRVRHWRAVAKAIAAADAEVVAVPLRGARVSEHWLAEVVAALEGSRVAAVVGAGLAPEDPPSVLGLSGGGGTRARFSGAGAPPQFIALRRDLYDAVGGIDAEVAQLGWTAPVLDYVERALDAGLTVGRLDTHGVEPQGAHRPARSIGEWHRSWARGALHADRARRIGGAKGVHAFVFTGVGPLLRFRRPDRTGRKSIRHAAGSLAAFLLGAATAARPQPGPRRDV
ncbi:MAG TPA: glycosyltransferase family 2 protein [Thermoleophilaceae bacterium]|nr:glycosyltransferase family 2 protein [Thermoleophilaceae bacterium]